MIRTREKKKFYQRVAAAVLTAALLVSSFPVFRVGATSGAVKRSVDAYKGSKAQADWTVPEEEGKVFAGWFEDEQFQKPYMGTTGEAYAKFVDAKVLTVKTQISSETSNDSKKTNIRFLTAVDSIDFQCVGFDVHVDGENSRTFHLREHTAYSSVLVDGKACPETASKVFGTAEAKYFVLHSITGIPDAVFDDLFTAVPYWYTLDGTKVYGETHTFTIREKIGYEINGFGSEAGRESILEANDIQSSGTIQVKFLDEQADGNGVTKQGVAKIDLAPADSEWPAVRFGRPLCDEPPEGMYDYVVFSVFVEGWRENLVLDYKDKDNHLLSRFKVKNGWTDYWVSAEKFDYVAFARGDQFFVPYNAGNPVTHTMYVDRIRYANRIAAENTDMTAEYMNFGGSMSLTEFGTVQGSNWCTWLEEYQGASGVVRMEVTAQWPSIWGFTPRMSRQDYLDLGYGADDYFVIRVYKEDTNGQTKMVYSTTGKSEDNVNAGDLAVGWNTIRIPASVILDHFEAFENGTAYIMPTNDYEITQELYFDAMYFEKGNVINDFGTDDAVKRVIDANPIQDTGTIQADFLDEKTDENGVTKQGVAKIDLAPEKSPWPGVNFGRPFCEKPADGKYQYVVFTMYAEGIPDDDTFQLMYKKRTGNGTVQTFDIQPGWREYWMPAEGFHYEDFAAGEEYLGAYMSGVNITQILYIDSIRYENRAKAEITDTTAEFLNFGDALTLTEFGTKQGSEWCTWQEAYQGAQGVARMDVTGMWASIWGFTPKMNEQAYRDLGYGADDYFVIRMYKKDPNGGVKMVYSTTGKPEDNVEVGKLTVGWNTIRIPAGVILDHFDAFVNGTGYIMPTNDYEITQELYFDAMYFEKAPASVWCAPGTQKIRPDVAPEQYAEYRMDGLDVRTGRSEYESAQIIMTAARDIESYELKVGDLTLEGDPTARYSADNIQVFHQKYINVTTIRESSPLSTKGLYPDALVPFSAAKEAGENKASAGNNQGIWVTFYAPKGQRAGVYTGTFLLDMDGCRQEIPVSLKVWDTDLAENHTAKSCFLIDWTSFSYAELDSSQDMYDAYAKALLEYRLQPGLLMNDFARSDAEDMKYYAKKAFAMAQDPRCNVVFMPYEIDNGRGDTYLVKNATKNWIRSFVDVSFESYGTDEQLNLVAKTMTYFTFIDEPTMNRELIPRVNAASAALKELRAEVKQECLRELEQAKAGITEEEYKFRLEVINDIEGIRNVLTSPHDSEIQGVEVYCPLINEFDEAEYAGDMERWWYTAVGPHYPYPTYHIDDTNLLGARMLSWMQADYDVAGTLYWGTNIYNAYSTEEFLEDPYENAMRFTGDRGANGDGFLFYPGKRFGIDGPVGTIRLQAIRDGMEEYETLRGIQQVYQKIGIDFDSVYQNIKENLYSGTMVKTSNLQTHFEAARELMGSLAELASIGGAVESISLNGNQATVRLAVPKGYTVSGSGNLNVSQWESGYEIVTVTQTLDKNVFQCSVQGENKALAVKLYLNGADSRTRFDKGITVGSNILADEPADRPKKEAMTSDEVSTQTDVLLYDFEAYDRSFQLMRVMSYFGAVNVNRDPQYVKSGTTSALLQPLGYHSTMIGNTRQGIQPESCLYIPFTSETYGFDYSDSGKIREIRFSLYNVQETQMAVYVGLIYEKNAVTVSEPVRFLLQPGWNDVVYEVDHSVLALNYDLSSCYGMALSFDRVNSREREDAPKLYLDNIRLELGRTAVIPDDLIALEEHELCDFERSYQQYVVKSRSHDKAHRPSLEVVSAGEYGMEAPSGQKILRAVLKPTDGIDGTIYDSIYLTQPVVDRANLKALEDNDRVCFEIYNDSNQPIDIALAFQETANNTYRTKNVKIEPGTWTSCWLTMKEIDALWGTGEKTYRNNPGEVRLHWSEFTGKEKVIYLDDFRIEKKLDQEPKPNPDPGWGAIS